MPHSLLSILRYFLLAAIWLFFIYAARMVWVEVRRSRTEQASQAPAAAPVVSDKALALRLRVVDPPQRRGRVFELGDEVTVGRSPGCAVPLDDDTFASSIHARVFRRSGELWIEDLGSTNGTFLNDERFEAPVRLNRGPRQGGQHCLGSGAVSRLKTAAATHTGYLRTTNQDLALATTDLAAVADGMGGHVGGEVAARIAVEHLLEAYRRDRTTEGLLAAVQDANQAIYYRSKSERNLRGMGTTLTAVAVVGEEPDGQVRLALVNVGDSRGYLLDRPEARVHKLTEDHSVVEEMVRSGELTPEEAFVHPHKHILTRGSGSSPRSRRTAGSSTLSPEAGCFCAATGSRTSSARLRSPR